MIGGVELHFWQNGEVQAAWHRVEFVVRHYLEATVNAHGDYWQLHSLGYLKCTAFELAYLTVASASALREHHKAHTTSKHTFGGLQGLKSLTPFLAVNKKESGSFASPANERPCGYLFLHNPLKRHTYITIDKEYIIYAGVV